MKNGIYLKHLHKKIIRAERNREKALALAEAKQVAFERGFLPNEIYYGKMINSNNHSTDTPVRQFVY